MRKICYSKLWKLLIDKRMNGSELRKAVELAPNTLTKLYKEEPVSVETLLCCVKSAIKKAKAIQLITHLFSQE